MFNDLISKNIIPLCRNCKYYKPSKYDRPFSEDLGVCIKYAYKCHLKNKIVYDYAILVRDEIDKCGPSGIYFKSKSK